MLDAKGWNSKDSEDLEAYLLSEHQLDPECAQNISAAYNKFRNRVETLNNDHQAISVRKTFNYPIEQVYDRAVDWFESEKRAELQHHINKKRLQCKWLSDDSNVGVKFERKSKDKTLMTVNHNNLDSETDAEIMRNFWKERIPKMIQSL